MGVSLVSRIDRSDNQFILASSRILIEKHCRQRNKHFARSLCRLIAMNINKLLHSPNVAGQSLVDRVTAAKHSLAGERLAKFVCKATTEELIPPKKKHIDREFRVEDSYGRGSCVVISDYAVKRLCIVTKR